MKATWTVQTDRGVYSCRSRGERIKVWAGEPSGQPLLTCSIVDLRPGEKLASLLPPEFFAQARFHELLGQHGDACPTCRALGDATWWGERVGSSKAEPPEAGRLEPQGDRLYRCPTCGTWYDLEESSQTFLDSDYDSVSLERIAPDAALARLGKPEQGELEAWLARLHGELHHRDPAVRDNAAHTLARYHLALGRRDGSELERLLNHDDEAVQLVALTAMHELVGTPGSRKLKRRFRDLLRRGSAEVRRVSARLLALQLFAEGRRRDVRRLLEGADPAALEGALAAVERAGKPEEMLEEGQRHLLHEDGGVVRQASSMLRRLLSSAQPELRRQVVLLLARAAEQRPAVLRDCLAELGRLVSDPVAGHDALSAIAVAARLGESVSPVLWPLSEALTAPGFSGDASDVLKVVESLLARDANVTPLLAGLGCLREREPGQVVPLLQEMLRRGLHVEFVAEQLRKAAGPALDLSWACHCNKPSQRDFRQDKAKGYLRVVDELVHTGWSEIFVVCNLCGRRWKVEEDTSYHFTTYSWEEITGKKEHAHRYG